MVTNLSNIGQMLISATPETQFAPAHSDTPKTKKFSVSDEDSFQNNQTCEFAQIEANTDMNQKRAEKALRENEVYQDQKTVYKNDGNQSEKIQSDTKPKQAETDSESLQENDNVEEFPFERHNAGVGNIVRDLVNNYIEAKKEQTKQTIADHVSEKSNFVTGLGMKSAEIKSLIAEEKDQLGIKTIQSEKSNGQNSLKEVSIENTQNKAEEIIAQKQETPEGLEQTNKLAEKQEFIRNLLNKNEVSDKPEIKELFNKISNEHKIEIPAAVIKDDKNAGQLDTSKTNIFKNQEKAVQQFLNVNANNAEASSNTDKKQKIDPKIQASESIKVKKELFNEGLDASGDTVKKKVESAGFQLSSEKIKNKSDSVFNNKSDNVIEQVISNTNAEQTEKATDVTGGKIIANRENFGSDISSEISKQISESIQNSMVQNGSDKQITVRLNPPELGSVLIKFSEQETQLTGILEVSKSQTKIEIEQALPQIIRNLAESGIQLKRVEVVSSGNDHAQNDLLKEQSFSENNSDHYNSMNQHERGSDINMERFQQWYSNAIEYDSNNRYENQYVGSGAINMLA